jgi:predicted DNA-binding transcriptional regulator AlpA
LVDTDELVDQNDIAPLIGLDNPRGVAVYRRRYADFPQPVIAKRQAVLWRRSDVIAWARSRRRNTGNTT